MAQSRGGYRNRLATVFWYLNDVPDGGTTNFPRAGGLEWSTATDNCAVGLHVKPQKGTGIMFYNLGMDGFGDEYSLHAACPVKAGVKWGANKWVHNEEYSSS
jgi:prolyl 4-hydroxylase